MSLIQTEKERREARERRDQLKGEMDAWKKSEDVKAYADALERVLVETQGAVDPESSVGQWIAWIRKYAGSIDPFREIRAAKR